MNYLELSYEFDLFQVVVLLMVWHKLLFKLSTEITFNTFPKQGKYSNAICSLQPNGTSFFANANHIELSPIFRRSCLLNRVLRTPLKKLTSLLLTPMMRKMGRNKCTLKPHWTTVTKHKKITKAWTFRECIFTTMAQYGNIVYWGNPCVMKKVTILKIFIGHISNSIVCLGCF